MSNTATRSQKLLSVARRQRFEKKIWSDIFGKPKMQFPSHSKSNEHSEHHSLGTVLITQIGEKFKQNRKRYNIIE